MRMMEANALNVAPAIGLTLIMPAFNAQYHAVNFAIQIAPLQHALDVKIITEPSKMLVYANKMNAQNVRKIMEMCARLA